MPPKRAARGGADANGEATETGASEPTAIPPIPKRRRTADSKSAPRSSARAKKGDPGADEDDVNSLFWLVEAASKEDLKGLLPGGKGGKAKAKAGAGAKKATPKKTVKKEPGAEPADSEGPPSNKESSPSGSKGTSAGLSTPNGAGGLKAYKGSTQQWTVQEDNQLRRLVDEHGHRKWSFIASKMNGRRGKQCRDRWLNHLKPDIRRGEWTQEEERILVEGHRMLGTRWAALAKLLPGRPENAIKNHWHATLRCKWAQRGEIGRAHV